MFVLSLLLVNTELGFHSKQSWTDVDLLFFLFCINEKLKCDLTLPGETSWHGKLETKL